MEIEKAKEELQQYGVIKNSIEKLRKNPKFIALYELSDQKQAAEADYVKRFAAMTMEGNQYSEEEKLCLCVDTTLDILYPDEKDLLIRYFKKEESVEQIGEQMHVSSPRVYQLLKLAIEKYAFCRNIVDQAKLHGI